MLREVQRVLKKGAVYVCVSLNKPEIVSERIKLYIPTDSVNIVKIENPEFVRGSTDLEFFHMISVVHK